MLRDWQHFSNEQQGGVAQGLTDAVLLIDPPRQQKLAEGPQPVLLSEAHDGA